jgi:hypothetical protein
MARGGTRLEVVLLALGGYLISCCVRYRGFDVGFIFHFH